MVVIIISIVCWLDSSYNMKLMDCRDPYRITQNLSKRKDFGVRMVYGKPRSDILEAISGLVIDKATEKPKILFIDFLKAKMQSIQVDANQSLTP